MGGGPSDKPVGEPPAVGALQWLADWLGAARQQALVSEVGMDSTAQNSLGQDLRAEMAALSPPPARCAVCRREYTRTYANNGVYIWDHADGTSCNRLVPNHLQYWARELDRPIETRSIEEQQRARDREADAARVWQAWQESLRDRDQELAREQDNLLREASAAARIREEDRRRRIAADRESARRANAAAQISDGAFPNIVEAEEQWNRWAPFKVEKPEPKKLPIAKPMKRVFNFASD